MRAYKKLAYYLILVYSVFLILLPISVVAAIVNSFNISGQENQSINENNIVTVEEVLDTSSTTVEEFSSLSICEEATIPVVTLEQEVTNSDETLYDTLSEEEITLIELTVQHEVGSFSIEYKELIAGIILNRLNSPDFPDTIIEILYEENQFSNGNYAGVVVDDDTVQAVENVFTSEAPPHDATYYYNPDLSAYYAVVWFEYSGDVEYLFSYSEEDWGIIYNTRFFK